MENPWKNIKNMKSDYIAISDKDEIKNWKTNPRFDFTFIPQPFLGDPVNAKVFLLNGNPNDVGEHKSFLNNNKKIVLENLEHKIIDYPLFCLNKEFEGSSIYTWWYKRLRQLIEEIGNQQQVSKNIFVAEYLPYFSENYRRGITLPSQEYTFDIVRNAIHKDKMIIIMRARKNWEKSIDELIKYPYKYVLHSPQNVYVTRNNLGDEIFEKIKKLIK
jgi:hypothetical protein